MHAEFRLTANEQQVVPNFVPQDELNRALTKSTCAIENQFRWFLRADFLAGSSERHRCHNSPSIPSNGSVELFLNLQNGFRGWRRYLQSQPIVQAQEPRSKQPQRVIRPDVLT
jgi:hypothetical protein